MELGFQNNSLLMEDEVNFLWGIQRNSQMGISCSKALVLIFQTAQC
jgi:hypothetical protein